MALTKVKLIADGTIVQSNLHASHGITTADIGEGSNLYYTDARARAAVSVSGNALSYDSSTGVITSNFEESPTFTGNVVIDGTLGVGARTTITDSAGYLFDVQTTDTNQPRFQVYVDDTTGVHLISGYNTTAKSMLFNTGGSERMRINSSGNIGIGTTSPTYKLHVAGTTAITGNLTMSTSAEIRSSDGTGIRLRNAANSANEGGFVRSGLWEGDSSRDPSLFAETGLGLRFYTGGSATERMTINSSGDVDIANTIYTGESLRFNGTGLNATDKKLYSPTDGELQWFTHNLAGAKAFSVSHQGTRQVYLNVSGNSYLNGGNVGIGTTSPSAKLDVQSSGAWGQYGRGSSGDITVENTNTSVTEGGWIGIAGYMGNTANGGYYHMAGITAKKSTTAGDGNYGGDLSFWTTAGSGQSGEANSGMYQRMTINRFGNVGINVTSPNAGLQIALGGTATPSAGSNTGSVCFGNTTSGNAYGLVMGANSSGVGYISSQRTDGTATTYNLAMQPNGGNVGIGETSPSGKLHIKGSDTGATPSAQGNSLVLEDSENGLSILSSTAGAGYINFGDSDDNNIGMIIYDHSSNSMRTWVNAAERMRIDSSGVVDITGGILDMGQNRIDGSSDNLKISADNSSVSGLSTIEFLVDGSEKMRINNSGNVGIGTTSPSKKLHVVGDQLIYGNLYLESTSGSYRQIAMNTTDGADNQSLYLCGGGTASGVRGAQVIVKGNEVSSEGGSVQIQAGRVSTGDIIFKTGVTVGERMRIDEAGNIGIGTSSPSQKLHVSGGNILVNNGNSAEIHLNSSSNYVYGDINGVAILNGGNNLRLRTNGSERIRIDSSGNVGIGETSPDAKLHVVSTTTPQFKVEYDNSRYVEIHHSAIFNVSGAGQSNNFYIGTRGNSGNNSIVFYTGGTTGTDAGTERVRITQAGNVGIGTTSPSVKLSVVGGMIAGTNNTQDGKVELYGDIRRPQANQYTERVVYKSPGSSAATYTIARQWHDHVNWGSGLINLIIWSVYPYQSAFGKADFSCRYGYSGGAADVVTNFNQNSGVIATPTWTSATQVSGNIYYRDLQVTVPAYHQFVIKIINPGALTQTYNVNNTSQNHVYFYS